MIRKICLSLIQFNTFFFIFILSLSSSGSAHQVSEIIEPPPMERLFRVGDRAPDFTLTNHKGETVSLHDWQGKIVLLSFISSECVDRMCPILLNKYINIQIDLEQENKLEREIILAAITVEPAYDTVKILKNFAAEQRIYPDGVHLLTGRPESAKKTLKGYGVLVLKEGKEFLFHHNLTLLIGRDGVITDVYYGDDAISDDILDRSRQYLFNQ
jgi:cytochrome oxidase Cu insertion factor (SCO1/SenC/PrrC family)